MDLNKYIIVRGGGDLATGTIIRLHRAGYPVLILETETPSAIRRSVSFSEAVYDEKATVEGVTAKKIALFDDIDRIHKEGLIPLMIDPDCSILKQGKPLALIDGIIAKQNIGTHIKMADFTIGLGPGFVAGKDVNIVIETKRGHNLGEIITEGSAAENTGVPGAINGISKERVIHATANGRWEIVKEIGKIVSKGDCIATINQAPIFAPFDGIIRGSIRDGFKVTKGLKVADIDPRKDQKENCYTISDKARTISGSVLEVVVRYEKGLL